MLTRPSWCDSSLHSRGATRFVGVSVFECRGHRPMHDLREPCRDEGVFQRSHSTEPKVHRAHLAVHLASCMISKSVAHPQCTRSPQPDSAMRTPGRNTRRISRIDRSAPGTYMRPTEHSATSELVSSNWSASASICAKCTFDTPRCAHSVFVCLHHLSGDVDTDDAALSPRPHVRLRSWPLIALRQPGARQPRRRLLLAQRLAF